MKISEHKQLLKDKASDPAAEKQLQFLEYMENPGAKDPKYVHGLLHEMFVKFNVEEQVLKGYVEYFWDRSVSQVGNFKEPYRDTSIISRLR